MPNCLKPNVFLFPRDSLTHSLAVNLILIANEPTELKQLWMLRRRINDMIVSWIYLNVTILFITLGIKLAIL